MRSAPLLPALAGLFVAFGPVAGNASPACYSHHHSSAHTPVKGSMERTAIMAAIHARTGIQALLNIDHMKVSHGWAWVIAYRPGHDRFGVLLRGGGGGWRATEVLDGDDFTSDPGDLEEKFPDVPTSIFR